MRRKSKKLSGILFHFNIAFFTFITRYLFHPIKGGAAGFIFAFIIIFILKNSDIIVLELSVDNLHFALAGFLYGYAVKLFKNMALC